MDIIDKQEQKAKELKMLKRIMNCGKPNPKHYDDFQAYLQDLAKYQGVAMAKTY